MKKSEYNGLEIAVIGMSLRTPGANNIDAFWENLCKGKNSITFFSDDELLSKGLKKSDLNNENYVKAWGVVDDKDRFDSAFFGYMPEEAKFLDPQIRLFHETVWEAIEDAGFVPSKKGLVTGLYAGACENIPWKAYSYSKESESSLSSFYINYLNNKDYISALTSYKLNLNGPVIFTQTACSTSLVTTHLACRGLLMGECDIAIAGGVNINSYPKNGYVYNKGMILSPDGFCRPFDNDAGGTVGGEGAGVLILKRLEDAIRDNDDIKAIIKGSAINNDGSKKVGFTAPSVEGQKDCIEMALKVAEVEPESIGYIEAHGTGTLLGDPIEVEALKLAYGNLEKQSIPIGSIKSNLGHLDVAAGAVGLIKTILSLKNKKIPPSLNFNEPNKKIGFENTPFFVNDRLSVWESINDGPLRAGVSSFGIGGTNAHIILEEAPSKETKIPKRDNSLDQVFLFSAKTETALGNYLKKFGSFITTQDEISLQDIAYTLAVGRGNFQYKKAIVANSITELKKELDAIHDVEGMLAIPYAKAPITFVFSGQGSQYVNMGKDIYNANNKFKAIVDEGFRLLKSDTSIDFKEIVFPLNNEKSDTINNTKYAQPLIFLFEYALTKLIMSWGITPDYMIGHSVGEYTAACISGMLSFEDTLSLLAKRGSLVASLPEGSMLSAKMSEHDARNFVNETIVIAAVNGEEQIVFSGDSNSINELQEQLNSSNIVGVKLHTSHAFHSHMMDPIIDQYRDVLSNIEFGKPSIPFMSNVTGKAFDFDNFDVEYWCDHLRGTIHFYKGIDTINSYDEKNVYIELGPGNVLTSLISGYLNGEDKSLALNLLRHPKIKANDYTYLMGKVASLWEQGILFNWGDFYANDISHKVSLPTYSFDEFKYLVEVNQNSLFSLPDVQDSIQDNTADFYLPSWKKTYHSSENSNYTAKTCLFLGDNSEFSKALGIHLQKEFSIVITLFIGEDFNKQTKTRFHVNPKNKEQQKQLFEALKEEKYEMDVIVNCWPLCITKAETADDDKNNLLLAKTYNQFHTFLEILKGLAFYNFLEKSSLYLITESLHKVLGNEKQNIDQSVLLGLLKVISQETSLLYTCNLDVETTENVNVAAMKLLNEMKQTSDSGTVALRNEERWELTFNDIQIEDPKISEIKNRGTYVITGGLGNLGYVVGAYLLEKYNAKIIILGRTNLEDDIKTTVDPDKLERFNSLSTKGEINYVSVDLSNKEGLVKVIENLKTEHKEINGIIHAAGMLSSSAFQLCSNVSIDNIDQHFQPKIDGLVNLLDVFKETPLDFVWVTSSIASYLGGLGYSVYSSSNVFMDYYLNSSQINIKKAVVVNLDALSFGELVNDPRARELTICSDEITTILEKTLKLNGTPNVIVAKRDFHQRFNKLKDIKEDKESKSTGQVQFKLAKVNRSGLSSAYKESVLETEKELIDIWELFFGLKNIGVCDNFFELGGDSLKALSLLKEINKRFNKEITVVQLFESSNVEGLATLIDEVKSKSMII